MTTDQSQATPPKEGRMITDADLDYLRNINTSPGPNAGHSIDPTKPGPDADRASPEPQDVREALNYIYQALDPYKEDKLSAAFRTVEHAALSQSDAEPAADAGLIEAAEWLSTAASRFEEAADALRAEYKTYARQMDRWAGDTRERARLFRILSRAADRSVHGELIPDCPTDGVAARQGNGG